MYDIKSTNEQREAAWDFVKDQSYGNRGVANGTMEQQYFGILGQLMICDELDLPRPQNAGRFDGGWDITIRGKKIDIKTMLRTVPMKEYYVHNLLGFQKDYPTDFYLFCSYNKPGQILTVCGMMTKKGLNDKVSYYEKGIWRKRDNKTEFQVIADTYEIRQNQLMPTWNKSNIFFWIGREIELDKLDEHFK